MHRTLKAETARPPAKDRQRQQRCFDCFCEEYNQERPHEALGQQPPATAYAAAGREYPTQIPEPEYPGHWERRRVRQDGRVKFHGRMYFLSEALAGETTGRVEVAEDIWQIWFGPLPRWLSTTQPRGLSGPWAWPLAAPAGAANLSPILLPIRPVCSVTHQTGRSKVLRLRLPTLFRFNNSDDTLGSTVSLPV